jgi:Flp pilus assembly protein TadD
MRRAVALNPRNPEDLFRLGFTLFTSGRVRDGLPVFEQAKALDPLYSTVVMYDAWSLATVGRDTEAVAEARRGRELDPDNEAVNTIYGSVMMGTGQFAEAVAQARRMVPRTTDMRRLGFYGLILARSGQTDEARALLRRIDAAPDGTWGKLSSLSRINLALGDTARALGALEKAAAGDGDLVISQLISSKHFDPIRKSPRFAAVLRKFNLDVDRLTAPDGGRSR